MNLTLDGKSVNSELRNDYMTDVQKTIHERIDEAKPGEAVPCTKQELDEYNDKQKSLAYRPDTATTPAELLSIAVQQGADLDKLTKLMDLQERWEANEARKAYVAAMSQFRAQAPSITKTRKAHNSMYAGLAETIDEIKGILTDCGLSHSWKTKQDADQITVTCCVTHIMGHSECTSLTAAPDTSGSKNSIQAVASTVTYLERYTLYAILGLASKEQDNDGNVVSYISLDQLTMLKDMVAETKADEAKLCEFYKVPSLEAITTRQYQSVLQGLNAKKTKGDKK
jgi:hypothetical protein